MPRSVNHLLILVFGLSLTGCASGFHGSYYDPCGGCVYGPGFEKPGLLTKLFRKDHKHERDCPLCAAEHEHGHSHNVSQASYSSAAYSNASYGAPNCAAPSCAAPNCAAPNCAAPNCAAPSYAAPANCSAPVSYPVSADCSAPMDCSCAGGVSYDSGSIVHAPSTCSSCGGFADPGPITSGCSGCSGEVVTGCSGCAGGISGGVIYDGGASGHCSACEGGTIGPVYEGEIRPGDTPVSPGKPAPAPAAETPGDSTTYVTPGPDAPMMIPAFAEKPPTRQVHWVPSSLK